MGVTRREWFATAAAAWSAAAAFAKVRVPGVRFGVCDSELGLQGNPEAFALARKIGFEGVEVNAGDKPAPGGGLLLSDPAARQRTLEAARASGLPITGLCLEILHVSGLKGDPLGPKWVAEAVSIAAALKAPTVLLPFFDENVPKGQGEVNALADRLKEPARAAEKAGVVLGFESPLRAEALAPMLTRVDSPALKVFYDVGNMAEEGADPVKEIRFLSAGRIAAFHFKDRAYLGQGKLDFAAILQAIADIGFKGWIDFETPSPAKSIEADMRKNLGYIRGLME